MIRISRQTKNLAIKNYFLYDKSTHTNAAAQYDLKVNINSKNDFMDELNKLSSRIVNTFETSSYMNSTKSFWLNQLGSHRGFKQNYERLMSFNINEITLKQIVDFSNENLDQFTIKEKSIIIRLISAINSYDPKYFKLLQKLEIDFYYNIDNCDLVDLNNFYSGMSVYRSCTKHFLSKTLDHTISSINRIIINDNLEATNDLFFGKENHLANEINKQWLNRIDYKNDILFSIYMLKKLNNYLIDVTKINKNLLSNGYIINQIKTENIENISEKLVIHSHFHSSGFGKNFDLLATNKFYSDLNETNLINNLNKIHHPILEKHYVKYIISKHLNNTKENYDLIVKFVESFICKLNETTNIYNYSNYLSSLSLLLSSKIFTTRRMINDFKAYNNKYEKIFTRFIHAINEKQNDENKKNEIVNFDNDTDIIQKLKNECKNNAQEKIKSFKRSDLDLYLIFELVSLKRNYEPFYWISKKTISHIFTNIIENIQIYHQSDFPVLINILEIISSSYPDSQIPDFILNYLYKVLIDIKFTNKSIKISILKIILRNKELISKKFHLIYQIIDDILINDCLIHDVVDILKTMNKNLENHVEQNKTKTNDIINRTIELIVKDLCEIDKNSSSDEKTKTTLDILSITKQLHKSKETIKIKNFKNNINDLKLKKEQMIDNFNQLNMKKDTNHDIDNEIKRLEIFFYNYSLKIKCLCELSIACNQFDKDLFYEAMISSVQILTIFEKAMFSYEKINSINSTEYLLKTKRFVMDLLTCYGIFDYFDLSNFLKNLDKEELKIYKYNHLKLEEINDRNYSTLKNYFQKNIMSLIKYSFSMQNLKFSNSQALDTLFQKNITIEDIFQRLNIDKEVNY